MSNLLDFFAQTHTPYLHARGRAGTAALFRELRPAAGQRILELGFGTGHTLVELGAHCPGLELYGLEKSPLMLGVAQRRFRFCGLGGIQLDLYAEKLPFADLYFDAVFTESVLAILPDKQLPDIFNELYRVLKPGGRLCCNESVWRPEIGPETIEAINRQCRAEFGIPQASARFPYPEDWKSLGKAAGFRQITAKSLEGLPIHMQFPKTGVQFRSNLFSRMGWLKSRFSPGLISRKNKWRAGEKRFAVYGRFLEGWLFVFEK